MKKTIAKSMTAIMAAAMIAGSLTACGGSDNKAESTTAVETTVEASESVEETTAEAADAEETTEAADAESPPRLLTLRSLAFMPSAAWAIRASV